MRIFVIGGTGRVAGALVESLVAAGHTVTAGVRRPEAFTISANATAVHFDLTASVEAMAAKFAQHDAIYFVAGSRGKNLLQVEIFGAIKSMQAAEAAGVQRYVMLSSLFATEPTKWIGAAMESLADYNVSKFVADKWLINNTHLDYTILQPGTLVDAVGTGAVKLGVTDGGKNAIADVGAVLAALADAKNTFGKIITMHAGDTPIDSAVAEF